MVPGMKLPYFIAAFPNKKLEINKRGQNNILCTVKLKILSITRNKWKDKIPESMYSSVPYIFCLGCMVISLVFVISTIAILGNLKPLKI